MRPSGRTCETGFMHRILTCGVAVLAQLSAKAHADPIAAYVLYLLGESPVVSNPAAPWGVKLDDERAVVRFLAMWNDDARLRAGEHVPTSDSDSAFAV
jgi:hypothetical protein